MSTLVLAGTESSDGYTGTVPEMVAGVHGSCRRSRSRSTSRSPTASRSVQRQTEAGYDQVECTLPAVVSVTAGVVEPRYPSFKGIMAAKKKPVDPTRISQRWASMRAAVGVAGGSRQETVERDRCGRA